MPRPLRPLRGTLVTGVAALVLVGATGCTGSRSAVDAATTPVGSSSAPGPSSTALPSTTTWPLTGIAAPPTGPAAAVLMVKVENDSAARPQAGIDQADTMVEELVEGGATRFAALFQSHLPATVGPVRSVRYVDAEIAAPVADVFAFSGGAAVTLAYLTARIPSVPQVTEGAPGFFRDTSRAAPRNLFLRPSALLAREPVTAVRGRTLVDASFAAASAGVSDGAAVTSLVLRFSSIEQPSWVSSPHGWLRSDSGAPAVTASGARITAQNILVLRVQTQIAGYKDPAGHPVPETLLTGTGAGILLEAGHARDVTWSKDAVDHPIELAAADGPVTLLPGPTWLELLPASGSLTMH